MSLQQGRPNHRPFT